MRSKSQPHKCNNRTTSEAEILPGEKESGKNSWGHCLAEKGCFCKRSRTERKQHFWHQAQRRFFFYRACKKTEKEKVIFLIFTRSLLF